MIEGQTCSRRPRASQTASKPACKPRSVRRANPPRRLSLLARALPRGSSSLPEAQTARAAPFSRRRSPLFGLAPDGGCQAARLATDAGGLLHRRFTLACPLSGRLSTVLKDGRREDRQYASLWPCPAGHPAPGVTRRRALWSADFPRSPKGSQSPGRLGYRKYYNMKGWNV